MLSNQLSTGFWLLQLEQSQAGLLIFELGNMDGKIVLVHKKGGGLSFRRYYCFVAAKVVVIW